MSLPHQANTYQLKFYYKINKSFSYNFNEYMYALKLYTYKFPFLKAINTITAGPAKRIAAADTN